MSTAFFTSIKDIKNSLGLVTREFSYRSSDIVLYVPSVLRYKQIPPRPKLIVEIAEFLQEDGKNVNVCLDTNKFGVWLNRLKESKDIQIIDLSKDRFRRTDGIESEDGSRFIDRDNLRIPVLRELYAYSTLFKDVEIIPVVTPHPSALLLVAGVLGSFLSVVPTETRTRILLESKTGMLADAVIEVFSLFYQKIPYCVYDFSQTFKWSGRSKPKDTRIEEVLISKDPVTGDALVSKIFGWPTLVSKAVRIAYDLRIGEAVDIESNLKNMRMDLIEMHRMINDRNAYVFPFNHLHRFSIDVNSDCDKCLECTYVCPNGSIRIDQGEISINRGMCVNCYACVDACPRFALEITRLF